MTREEILCLDTDQLRTEIAKAKGWRMAQKESIWGAKYYTIVNEEGHSRSAYDPPNSSGFPSDKEQERMWKSIWGPKWTTKISDAWELLDELTSSGMVDLQFDGMWKLAWFGQLTDNRHLVAGGETAILAICRVWLLWKRNENHGFPKSN